MTRTELVALCQTVLDALDMADVRPEDVSRILVEPAAVTVEYAETLGRRSFVETGHVLGQRARRVLINNE